MVYETIFQSTLPAGEATTFSSGLPQIKQFQSTLPAGEATWLFLGRRRSRRDFNPRFPRGKRRRPPPTRPTPHTISIHASRGGSDACILPHHGRHFHFNPRFPRGKRPLLHFPFLLPPPISIHASRGGSDERRFSYFSFHRISIHASRGGSDGNHQLQGRCCRLYFNPRFPRGKRQSLSIR